MSDIHPTLAAAIRYACEGFAPVPVPAGKKGPQLPKWQDLRLSVGDLPGYFGSGGNVGIITGVGNLVDIDLDSTEARILAPAFLPATDRICGRPGNPGSHWFYRCDPLPEPAKFVDPIKRADGRTMLVELRAGGQQTIVPPSVHPSGEHVVWEKDGAPADGDGRILRQQVGRMAAGCLLARHWPTEGGRHEAALALGGALAHAGWGEEDAAAFVEAFLAATDDDEVGDRLSAVRSSFVTVASDGRATGLPTLANLLPKAAVDVAISWLELRDLSMVRELERRIADIPGVTLAGSVSLISRPCTDLGNGERFADQHRDRARFSFRRSVWFAWTGTHWQQDEMGRVQQMAAQTARNIYREASDEADPAQRKALAAWARNSESQARRDAMLRSASSMLALDEQALDADPWTLNCRNGSVDLRTGVLRPHRPADLLAKICATEYRPEAACPGWLAFLRRILDGRDRLLDYLQRAVGYSLTGRVSDDALFFCFGVGRNGKSTFINTVRSVLHDYAMQASADLILAKPVQSHPTERASLYGKRFVATIEAGQAKKLDEQLVKQLTGGDAIRARRMREDEWEFEPTHKLWLAANHKPVIRGNDTGIWSRIKMIPFEVTIPPEEQDRDLDEKLLEEKAGILSWMVAGCFAWQQRGLDDPPEVQAATRAYRVEMDILADFLAECCATEARGVVSAKSLYEAYALWCVESGESAMSQRLFGVCLAERGFARCVVGHGNVRSYRGLRLIGDAAKEEMDIN